MKKCPDCGTKLHTYSSDPKDFWFECSNCWNRYDKEELK